MSINDLIHTNAHNAFEQGVKTERERIIEILKSVGDHYGCVWECSQNDCTTPTFWELIALIKGEQK